MNNIYKVIWSKAKNCYVVASEIARSHTKSASGSTEKIGGVTRKTLLALGAACAIVCGGFVNVGATVYVDPSTTSTTNEVYTKGEVDSKFETVDKDISNNANNIKSLQDNVGDSTKGLIKGVADNAKAIGNLGGIVGDADNGLVKDVKNLEKAVGDAGSGLTKEVADNATAIGKLETAVGDASNGLIKNVNDVSTKVGTLETTVKGKADASAVTAVADRVTAIETTLGDGSTSGLKKDVKDLQTSVENKANQSDVDDLTNKVGDDTKGLVKDVNDLKETVGDSTKGLVKSVADNKTDIDKLNDKTTQISFDNGSNSTKINGMDVGANQIDMASKNLTNVGTINGTAIGEKVTNGTYVQQDKSLWGNLGELDIQTKTNTEKIDELDKNSVKYDSDTKDKLTLGGNGGTTITNLKDATLSDTSTDAVTGKQLNATNTKLTEETTTRESEDTKLSNRIGTVANNGKYIQASNDTNTIAKNLEYLDTALASTDQRTSKITRDDTKNETTIEGKVTIDNNGNVKAEGTITGKGVDAGDGEVKTTGKVSAGDVSTGTLETTGKATIGGDLEVKGNLNVSEISMKNDKHDAASGDIHDSSTSITADGISNKASIENNGKTKESQFNHNEKGTFNHAKDGNSSDWKETTSNVTADGVENIAKDSKGNNNTFTQTSTETKNTLTDAAGNTSSTRQDAKGNYGYAKDTAGNKSYTKQQGDRIAESVIGQDGKETKSEMTTTDITNTAKFGKIKNDAKDIVNSASGNISNSSATMDTTVTGKATESYGELETTINGIQSTTVKGDVTEDYKKNLTTKVGGDELHEVTGTKTETITGKVTENFEGGQETNVTGDQTTKVSGTQTTTATDIKRNASSSMVDSVSNDYGTNTETKVAGKTTTDMTITGTGEKGQYIRGANESRDYLIKGTLKNSETKTAEATSTEITDGTNTSATIQDKANLAGSVTNGTETGVSGIHGNADGSVSIDSSVADKSGNISTINQKKGSITSSVSDGTNTTVISQDKNNVTIASNNGIVAMGGKDIINNATDTITNTAGAKITDIAGDSSVTTENEKGTTFTKTGSTAFSDATDAPKDTNISGNKLTTGRVESNELNVSDKDGANTADLNVKAGEGVTASAGNGTTTGSLDVKDNEVGSSVKDATGGTNGSDFRQRIDAIMGNVKSADGESEVIQKGNQITSEVGKGETTNSKVTQTKDMLQTALTDGTNYNVSQDAANASAKLLTDGTKINKTQDNLDSSERKLTNGTYETSSLQTALDITNTAKDGTIKNDAKDIENIASGNIKNSSATMDTTVTGKATESYGELETTVTGDEKHTVNGNQTNIIGGNQKTTVTGDISNSAKNITNEASEKLTDRVGDNTRVLDKDGITDTVGNTSFKQRINDIMMEAKNGTITSDAKNIVNKAAETITNDAVNITNTATGTISSNASEIKNKADKLISSKVGENTYQNIEDGKITESIKNGTKQNLTQSDADGTNHSVVDGKKSSVTKQTSEEITGAVSNGSSSNVTQNTATSSNNTIADLDAAGKPTKANSVISTVDGTTFVNSAATTPVTGASGDGTATNTTIKGNTITTGKVTMDYADVMKDLGVKGNTTLGEAGKDTILTVNSKATFNEKATFEKGAEVKKGLTVSSGGMNVTGESTFHDKVTMEKGLDVTGGVSSDSFTVKGTDIKIDSSGINAGGKVISNVADGSISEGSKDAVNGGQLYQVKNDLEGKVNKVGANAAAMANLHPMEFDPDSKWNIAAAMGNYGSETATAMGLFYRPNEDVMVNLSTAFGTGENMVGGGVSVRLGQGGNKATRKENSELKAKVDDLTARMDALLSVLNPNMSKDFPDVPENHWAYEAVSRLAGNDIIQGYPDGEFHGNRTMTRYEMAEIIYNALSRGASAEKKLVEEFKPELQALAASNKATADAPAEN